MKISFLLPHVRLSGGVKALLEYANRLKKRGHEVRILLPPEKSRWYQIEKYLPFRKKEREILPPDSVGWFDNEIPIEVLAGCDFRLLPPADILVASAWQTAEYAARLPEKTGKNFYFIQHYETLWTREKNRAEQTYRLPFQKIVISTWLKEILLEKFREPSDVLITPVDRGKFFCEKKQQNSPPRVCLLHHDYDWKGYEEGISAINKLRSRGREIDLVVFGGKIKDPKLLYEKAGFEFEYHYRPTGEALRKIFSSCDIYLCPSWFEGLGMPSMEAMACRCALVTTDTGGGRDYAIDGLTALVSPPKGEGHLARNLEKFIVDPALLKSLSENGYKKILEFDWEKNCDRLTHIFEKSIMEKK